jgi:ADP-L-glycero-D-manno-heptose 6-epimerase
MILLTGSNGFIASNFIKTCGESILKLDFSNHMDIFNSDFPWGEISKIYHLGAISNTTETDVDRIYNLNIKYSIALFEFAIRYKIPVAYASSASVYGKSFSHQINPLNYYALSKATVDCWVQDNMNKFSNVIGCRFYNVYGSGEHHKGNQASPIHQFSLQAKNNGVIKVFEGSEKYYRDFVHVDDAIKCMTAERESGIYDIGTSSPISFLEVAKRVSRKYDSFIDIISFPHHLKNKYQEYTCAQRHYKYDFISVQDFLESL